MIFDAKKLAAKAERRPPGYAEEVIAMSTKLLSGLYELSDENWGLLATKYRTPQEPNVVRWRKKGCATCKPIVAETRQSTPISPNKDHAN